MRNLSFPVLLLFIALGFQSCRSTNMTMREPSVRVELEKSDFTLSDQVSAEAKVVRILGIDWNRIFRRKTSGLIDSDQKHLSLSLASIPVIGTTLSDRTSSYALYNLMKANAGYDVVFYPQYEKSKFRPGLGIFYNKTTVKVTARLGKLNS